MGYGGIGPSAALPLLDRWGDIDFVVASRIRPNGARNAIPAGFYHGLLRRTIGAATPRARGQPDFSQSFPLSWSASRIPCIRSRYPRTVFSSVSGGIQSGSAMNTFARVKGIGI